MVNQFPRSEVSFVVVWVVVVVRVVDVTKVVIVAVVVVRLVVVVRAVVDWTGVLITQLQVSETT